MPHNIVGWFEIPVTDMERAIAFYERVFGITLTRIPLGPLDMAGFPGDPGSMGAAGALVRHPDHYVPSTDGVLIYFTSQAGDVAVELSRVEAAGGRVIIPRTLISQEIGYYGVFVDTEGNRVAVHSSK